MDKKILIKSAGELRSVSKAAANEYILKSDTLIAEINNRMSNRPDLLPLIGESNIPMMKDNHGNHVRFTGSILKNRNDEVLVETILWVFRAYRNHGFSQGYWAAQLSTWIDILRKALTEDSFEEIYPYYEWMQVNIPLFSLVSSKMDSSGIATQHHGK